MIADTIDELHSAYLTPDIYAQQQTSAGVTTFRYEEFFPEFPEEMDEGLFCVSVVQYFYFLIL